MSKPGEQTPASPSPGSEQPESKPGSSTAASEVWQAGQLCLQPGRWPAATRTLLAQAVPEAQPAKSWSSIVKRTSRTAEPVKAGLSLGQSGAPAKAAPEAQVCAEQHATSRQPAIAACRRPSHPACRNRPRAGLIGSQQLLRACVRRQQGASQPEWH